MFPKLFDEIQFEGGLNYSFLGVLTSCKKCEVTEARNGAYTLSLETTVNDECAGLITSQRLIGVKPNPFDNMQLFEIQRTERTYDGMIRVEAKHIKCLCFSICTNAYGAEADDPISFTGTPKQTWDEIASNYSYGTIPFSFASDITTSKNFLLGLSVSNSLGNILGGQEGSFLDVWGGEFKWDNFSISLLKSRGRNRNYKIQYGQNVSDAVQSESCENTYSHIMPFAWYTTSSGKKVSLALSPIAISGTQSVYNKSFILDCSEVLEPYIVGPASIGTQTITTAQAQQIVQEYATEYARVNRLGELNINIDVTIRAQLDDMAEIGLCDTVKVILDNFGTEASAKITKVVYDAILERWKSLTIGSPKVSMADLILNRRRFLDENK